MKTRKDRRADRCIYCGRTVPASWCLELRRYHLTGMFHKACVMRALMTGKVPPDTLGVGYE